MYNVHKQKNRAKQNKTKQENSNWKCVRNDGQNMHSNWRSCARGFAFPISRLWPIIKFHIERLYFVYTFIVSDSFNTFISLWVWIPNFCMVLAFIFSWKLKPNRIAYNGQNDCLIDMKSTISLVQHDIWYYMKYERWWNFVYFVFGILLIYLAICLPIYVIRRSEHSFAFRSISWISAAHQIAYTRYDVMCTLHTSPAALICIHNA